MIQRCNECGWPGQVLDQPCGVCSHVNRVPWTTDREASGENFETRIRRYYGPAVIMPRNLGLIDV